MNETVLVGLSGGVDSSVAALLLKRQGFNVVGAFMKNFSDTKNPLTGECNWVEERKMAQRVAALLKIKFITLDYEKQYKKEIISPMFQNYSKGLTPNPDVLCNSLIKFPALWKKAQQISASFIATGHYARIKSDGKYFHLLVGKDKTKDQSYFLHELSQKDLSHTLFPLGNLSKEEVRQIAFENNFPNWNKKGTRGICFVGNIDFKEFLKKKVREKKGRVLSPIGKVVGTHPGAHYFTIGERVGEGKGIIIENEYRKELGGKIYVVAKKANSLVVAPVNHPLLKRKEVVIKKIHFISPNYKMEKFKARIRHLGKLHSGILKKQSGKFKFIFDKGVTGIAEGQYIVLYTGREVIGGGEIRL